MSTDAGSSRLKYCPQCEAEFYSHAVKCSSCSVDLIYEDELAALKAAPVPTAQGALMCIEDCDLERANDLARILAGLGFEASVLKGQSGGPHSAGYGVFVAETQFYEAIRRLGDHLRDLHPEIREAEKRQASGQCPACGADLNASMHECPDCGLNVAGVCDNYTPGGGHCGNC